MIDLSRLADYFPAADIEWKPGTVTRDKKKGLAMAYITNRAIQQRLDDVCGPACWRNEFTAGPDGGVLCGLSVNVTGDPHAPAWVTKWDGADNTEFEATKGGLSGSMKRAAVQWGIGRYLYDLPSQWVPLNEYGKFAEEPKVPPRFLPRPAAPPARPRAAAQAAPARPASGPSLTPAQLKLLGAINERGIKPDAVTAMLGGRRLAGLSDDDAAAILYRLARTTP
jgi:hypothetical protein